MDGGKTTRIRVNEGKTTASRRTGVIEAKTTRIGVAGGKTTRIGVDRGTRRVSSHAAMPHCARDGARFNAPRVRHGHTGHVLRPDREYKQDAGNDDLP